MGQALSLNGLRVLVVEDETLVAMMLEVMLDSLGCDVVGVAGTLSRGLALAGDEALALDAAILDINLGGEKVYPLAERLAARGVPFIFCTGYGGAAPESAFAGVRTLVKPYQSQDLQRLLTSMLAAAPAH